MKQTKFAFMMLLFCRSALPNLKAQKEIPLVYDVENTGAAFKDPVMPTIDKLPIIEPLPDPFAVPNGKGRSTKFKDWSRHRADIAKMIQHYEIGERPVVNRDQMKAKLENNVLTVEITANGHTTTLTATITSPPTGTAPYPAVIGMANTLPANIFTERGVALINYDFNKIWKYGGNRGGQEFQLLFPNLGNEVSAYEAWSFGFSRIIDGLQMIGDNVTKIDTKHLACTGCSFAGKMALFSGAFDERVALTIAQESGGGGGAAWRFSQTRGKAEKLGATNFTLFKESFRHFQGDTISKLPYDHHMLCAMCCPRALLIFGNTDYQWLADSAGYVSARAAREVYKTFGIEDRIGFSIMGGHGHCQLPQAQYPELIAFIEKYLCGKSDIKTDVQIAPMFKDLDYARWTNWWGTKKPEFIENKN